MYRGQVVTARNTKAEEKEGKGGERGKAPNSAPKTDRPFHKQHVHKS